MPDGSHRPGKVGDTKPHEAAVWRGYFDCAVRILTVYSQGTIGWERIALALNAEGWAFRERKGKPRPLNKDDVRRVIANWREYAGLVPVGKAKDKIAARIEDPLSVLKPTGHNVIDMTLIRAVATAQANRSYKKSRLGVKREIHRYALTGIVYCAQCAQDAREKQNTKLMATLTGHRSNGRFPRYRHKVGHPCRAVNRSVLRDDIEGDFLRLIHLLTVDERQVSRLEELRALSKQAEYRNTNAPDPEEQKRLAIAKCRKRIEHARLLCVAGDMEPDEYLRIKEDNERDITHWEALTADLEQATLEFALCMETIDKIGRLWEISSSEDRQGMVTMLFE